MTGALRRLPGDPAARPGTRSAASRSASSSTTRTSTSRCGCGWRGGALGIEPARGRRPRLRVRRPRAQVALARAQPLGLPDPHLPGARCWSLLAPALLATELALIPVSIAAGWGRQKLAANLEFLRWLPRLLRERRQVQATRTVSAAEFAAWLTPDLDSPFIPALARSLPARLALRGYWRLVGALLAASADELGRLAGRADQDLVDVDARAAARARRSPRWRCRRRCSAHSPGRLSKNGVSVIPGSIRVTLIAVVLVHLAQLRPQRLADRRRRPLGRRVERARQGPPARRPSW